MAKRTLKRSNIGYLGMGADGRPIEKVYAWNPGGEGCSNGCDGCWARAIAKRNVHCEDCRKFRVHLHPERLCEPMNTRTPRLVLVNFTCDTFDQQRPGSHVGKMMRAMADADWHTYILLTQQPGRIGPGWYIPQGNEYLGLTIRNQQDADERLPDFFSIPGKKWISYEPAVGEVYWPFDQEYGCGRCSAGGPAEHFMWNEEGDCWQCPDCGDTSNIFTYRNTHGVEGIIIGHDRRKGAPGTDTLSHIRSCVEQCKAAGVNWWVKQVWVELCALCGCLRGYPAASNPCPHTFLETTKPAWRWMLLRASKPFEYALFPKDLRDGARLPWSAPKEQR